MVPLPTARASELPYSVLSMAPLDAGRQATAIGISADRRTLYVLERTSLSAGPPFEPGGEVLAVDVSDARAPRIVGRLHLDMPRVAFVGVGGTRLLFWNADGEYRSNVVVVDFGDPAAPRIIAQGMVEGAPVRFSRDGTCIGVGSFAYRVAGGRVEPSGCNTSTGTVQSIQVGNKLAFLADLDGDRAIAFYGLHLEVWQKSGPDRHTLLHIIAVPGVGSADDARFVATPGMLALLAGGHVYITSYETQSYDFQALARADADSVKSYDTLREHSIKPLPWDYDKFAQGLVNAGVEHLLPGSGPLSPLAARILNDYGFWLSHGQSPVAAVPVLQRAVTADSARTVAWLNLADAARRALPSVSTWQQKLRITRIALAADAAYARLTGSQTPAAKAFADFNIVNAPKANVCAYVAAFYNHNRALEMSGLPDPVDVEGNGRFEHVHVEFAGSLRIAVVRATPVAQLPAGNANHDGAEDFGLSCSECSIDTNIRIFPFKDRYYAVPELYGAPEGVMSAAGRPLCAFKVTYAPVLTEDHDHSICQAAVSGTDFPDVAAEALPNGGFRAAVKLNSAAMPTDVAFDRIASVDLTGSGHPDRIGFFSYQDWRGRGCTISRVALLNGDEVEQSQRNAELLDLQGQQEDCQGTTTSLIRTGHQVLIEVDGGRKPPGRLLLRVGTSRTGAVCRITQKPTYMGVPR